MPAAPAATEPAFPSDHTFNDADTTRASARA
jgi:hypothetical protein